MDTTKALISKSNQWRKETVIAVINALESGKTPDTSALAQNASRPVALGFSDSDLAYYRDHYISRLPRYLGDRDHAMSIVKRVNVNASRNGGRMSDQDRSKRDKALRDAQYLSASIKAIEEFNRIVVRIVEKREPPRGWDKVKTSVPEVETVTIVQAASTPASTSVFKKKAKHITKQAICRGEIKLDSFAALKEYQENTAIMLSAAAR
jgi:hypothetical protein